MEFILSTLPFFILICNSVNFKHIPRFDIDVICLLVVFFLKALVPYIGCCIIIFSLFAFLKWLKMLFSIFLFGPQYLLLLDAWLGYREFLHNYCIKLLILFTFYWTFLFFSETYSSKSMLLDQTSMILNNNSVYTLDHFERYVFETITCRTNFLITLRYVTLLR